MKINVLKSVAIIIMFGMLNSCQKNEDYIEPDTTPGVDAKANVNAKWDEVYRYNFGSNEDIPSGVISDTEGGSLTKGYDIQVGEPRVYPTQNIVHSQFRQTGAWNQIFCKVNPHYLIFNFTPVPYVAEISRPQGSMSYAIALGNAMRSPEWAASSQSTMKGKAEASFKDVKTYDEFNLSFGSNLSVGKFFSANMSYSKNSKQYKTTFIARFKSSSFDVDTYFDGRVTNENPVYTSQSYVSSITYGKVSYLVIFSNYSYEQIRTSINATFAAGIVSGGGNYNKETLAILQSSESYAFVSGNDITQPFYGNSPEFLNKLFSGTFDKSTIGNPIFFQLRNVRDNNLVDADKGYGWIEAPIIYINLQIK